MFLQSAYKLACYFVQKRLSVCRTGFRYRHSVLPCFKQFNFYSVFFLQVFNVLFCCFVFQSGIEAYIPYLVVYVHFDTYIYHDVAIRTTGDRTHYCFIVFVINDVPCPNQIVSNRLILRNIRK